MAIEIIDKLKQKNNGSFKILDAIDVELKDGSDLQTTVDFLKKNSSSLELDGELTSDYEISINTKDVSEVYGSINENLYQQFATLFKNMQSVIDAQQVRINDLESRVFALEQGSVVKPPVVDYSISIVDYNGDTLCDYDGNTLSDYTSTEEIVYIQITDYNGDVIADYNDNILTEYDTNTNVIYLCDYNNNLIIDNENNYIIEKEL